MSGDVQSRWIRALLVRDLGSMIDELELFPSDQLVWSTVPGITNSAGNITLHLCGNLQHFIGTVLGQTDYVRTRDLEFSVRGIPREQLIAELNRTIGVVSTLLSKQSDDVLFAEYPDVLGGFRAPTGLFMHQLCSHLAFHLGQVGYLRRVLTGDATSSGAMTLRALVPI